MALNEEARRIINEMAYEIRKLYDITDAIDDIKEVVKKMGGSVVEDPSISAFSDGRVKKIDADSFEIAISPLQTSERKNFTIAHELGHLFLHMGFKTDQKKWETQSYSVYYRSGKSDLEYQANEFAAAFLMPRSLYKEKMDEYTEGNYVDTAELADYFNVSIDAAANRGKWLGYLEW